MRHHGGCFTWCQDVVDEVVSLRHHGLSYGMIADEMQERGVWITRNGVAGILYRERHGIAPKRGRLTPEQLPLDTGESSGRGV